MWLEISRDNREPSLVKDSNRVVLSHVINGSNVAYQGQAAALVEKRVKASAGSKVGGIQEEVDEI